MHRELEGFARVGRIEADVAGVAVRRIRAHHQIALLGARRHAGGRPRPLDVENHGGHLGVVGEADELVHQRDARAGGRRKRAPAGPARTDHHADGSELVLRLQNRKLVLPGLLVDTELLAEAAKRVHQRRRRGDRIPRRDGRTGVDAAERRRRVAVDQNRILRLVQCLQMDRQRAGQTRVRIFVAEIDGLLVRVHQRRFPAELLSEQGADDVGVDLEQRRQRTDVGDVLHQDALTHPLECRVAHLGERHAEVGHVGTLQLVVQRPRRVVQQVAAGAHLRNILLIGRRVERHHQVEVRSAGGVAVFADPDLVPGGQALNVRRKDVLTRDGDSHAENRLHEESVRRSRSRSVGGCDLESEIVDPIHGFPEKQNLTTEAHDGPRRSRTYMKVFVSFEPIVSFVVQTPASAGIDTRLPASGM